MTAPNIVDVAAIKGESSVKTTLTTSPSTIVFNQVDSNQVYKLNSVVVTNVDGTNAADATVQLARQGVDYSIISTASVPADASLIVVSKETGIYLEEGDAIQAYASANGDLDISVSYETIAETANTLVTRGLVLYLDAADLNSYPSSGTTWYDLSTGANDGTMAASNPVFNSNGSSSSFTFDGNTSSFTVDATNIDFSTEQTIIMFLKPEEVGVSTRNPYNQEFAGYGAITQALTGGYIYYHGIGGANYQGTGSFNSQLANNEIGSIAVTRNSSTVQWYKNGEPKESANNTYPTANSTVNTITIGDGYTNGWLGKIYLALLYDRVLSNNEISQTYNALKGRFGL